jgi:long-chain acyl-CoA synthetase
MPASEVATLQQLAASLADGGNAPAVIAFGADERRNLRYAELATRVDEQASGFIARGLGRGEKVMLFAPNSVEWIIAALAVMRCGGVLVPIDAQFSGKPLAHVLGDCGARWLITTQNLRATLEALSLESPPEVLLIDQLPRSEDDATLPSGEEVEADAHAVIFYTSGTTGNPKGVPLTHSNLTSNVNAILSQNIVGTEERLLIPLPYHHVYPFVAGFIAPLQQRAAIVLPYSLVGPHLIRAMNEGRATVLIGVPRLYEALVQAVAQRVAGSGSIARSVFAGALGLARLLRKLGVRRPGRWLLAGLHQRLAPALRLTVSGGAALSERVATQLLDLGWELATGYGLTETSPILTFNPPGEGRLDSAGRALPGVDIRTSETAATAESPAEVEVRGPNVFAGYLNLEEKTRESFTQDGWYRTGDLGWIDESGYLHLTGRASQMIVMPGGENIDPEKIEDALKQHDDIRDAYVMEHDGQLLALLSPETAVLRECEEASALRTRLGRAVSSVGRELPSHHRISDFRISPDPLPRTRLGKLQRHIAEQRYQEIGEGETEPDLSPISIERMAPEDQQLLEIPAARAVWDYLCLEYPEHRLTPDSSPQLDLGIDSLGWVGLTLTLREQAGLDLPESAVGTWESVRDLLRDAASAESAEGGGDLIELLKNPAEAISEEQRRWLAPRRGWQLRLFRSLHRVLRATCRRLFHLQVDGPVVFPERGAFILAPRHLSALDPVMIASALTPQQMSRLMWAGLSGILFRGPMTRGFSRLAAVLPVDPAASPRTSLALGAAALTKERGLVWFPEGRRSPDGSLQPMRSGIGLLLAAHPVPVIPVWIEGTHEALPPDRRWPRRTQVSLRFGEAVDPETLAQRGEGDSEAERIAAGLGKVMAELGAVRQ